MLFRIVQEAITNTIKYSHADTMWLSLSLNEAELILSLCDNGIGFELDNIAQHTSFGLDGIRNRVMSLDGKVEFKNDQGAVIEAVFYGVTTQ
ncbi:MAG: ATP-binding protein [Glaciecola sp.]|nr:ATP-binding protein [Glaciecola sp.]MDG1815529.1 ATP-binding protein [Glaciecola sp.]MDG2100486.1 ATP-binding protein [Glaciecola sp.]